MFLSGKKSHIPTQFSHSPDAKQRTSANIGALNEAILWTYCSALYVIKLFFSNNLPRVHSPREVDCVLMFPGKLPPRKKKAVKEISQNEANRKTRGCFVNDAGSW